jgi:predicted metal-dependent hydrolase
VTKIKILKQDYLRLYNRFTAIDLQNCATQYSESFGVPVENIEFEFCEGYDYDGDKSVTQNVHGWRYETDEEETEREAKEARAAELKRRNEAGAKKIRERDERAELVRLKKKYGDT